MDGVRNVREAFNIGACQSVYDMVDHDQAREKWLSGCERMRESLGLWNSFDAVSSQRLGVEPAAVLVQGRAVFAKGGFHLETYGISTAAAPGCTTCLCKAPENRYRFPISPSFLKG